MTCLQAASAITVALRTGSLDTHVCGEVHFCYLLEEMAFVKSVISSVAGFTGSFKHFPGTQLHYLMLLSDLLA